MKVCIAEKPSVAREIARILGANARKDGYLEGNGYQVTWTFGHLCTLKTPDDYQAEWKRWQLHTLPLIPEKFEVKLIKGKGIKKQFGVIKKLVKGAELIINCGDAGQEGELIQRWVLQLAKNKKPIKRLWISSLTEEAIRKGFSQLQDGKAFDSLYYAGFSRAIGDWLLGINATRLYTLKYGGYKQVLSLGRVQTPTLALIVARHLEILNFKPEKYWLLKTKYRAVIFTEIKGKYFKKEDADDQYNLVKDAPFEIVDYTKKQGKEYAQKLYDLTSLQIDCNKRFNFSADRTLKIVQGLYEKKVVTYPRVDTRYLPEDQYQEIPGILRGLTNYTQFTQVLLQGKIPKTKRVFDNKKITDHHAIIPTGKSASGLSGDEFKVYDWIVRRFLAVFYPPCLFDQTVVIGESAGVKFKATGKQITDEGWKVLYPSNSSNEEDTKEDETQQVLPRFEKGEKGPHDPFLEEKITKPPKKYTEATLLKAMETAGKTVDDEGLRELMKENGIGRPSTRANIIETLFRRNYIYRNRKTLEASDTGVELIGLIQNDLLKSAELTGQWEHKLRQIEKKEYAPTAFINEMKKMIGTIVQEVSKLPSNRKITSNKVPQKSKTSSPKTKVKSKEPSAFTCPKCKKGNLLKGKKAFGCSRFLEGCQTVIPFVFFEKKISQSQVKDLITKGKTRNLKGFLKEGTKVNGYLSFDDNFQVQLIESEAETKTKDLTICPKCKKGKILKGKTAYGCSEWKNGCSLRVDFKLIKTALIDKKITKASVYQVIKKHA